MVADADATEATIVSSNEILCDHAAAKQSGDAGESVVLDRNEAESGGTGVDDSETAPAVVLHYITSKDGPGQPDDHACSSCCLDGISAKPAQAIVITCDAGRSAVDSKALEAEFVRIKHIDDVQVASGWVGDRGTGLSDERNVFKALDEHIFLASAGDV